MNILDLPDDMVIEIINKIGIDDLYNLSLTTKYIYSIIKDNNLLIEKYNKSLRRNELSVYKNLEESLFNISKKTDYLIISTKKEKTDHLIVFMQKEIEYSNSDILSIIKSKLVFDSYKDNIENDHSETDSDENSSIYEGDKTSSICEDDENSSICEDDETPSICESDDLENFEVIASGSNIQIVINSNSSDKLHDDIKCRKEFLDMKYVQEINSKKMITDGGVVRLNKYTVKLPYSEYRIRHINSKKLLVLTNDKLFVFDIDFCFSSSQKYISYYVVDLKKDFKSIIYGSLYNQNIYYDDTCKIYMIQDENNVEIFNLVYDKYYNTNLRILYKFDQIYILSIDENELFQCVFNYDNNFGLFGMFEITPESVYFHTNFREDSKDINIMNKIAHNLVKIFSYILSHGFENLEPIREYENVVKELVKNLI